MTTDKDARIAALEAENARLSALAPAPEPADDVRERVADELARFCHEPKGVLLIMADAALSALPARVSVAEAARVLLDPSGSVTAYVLQDYLHNRLVPRIVDIAYTAFMSAKRPNDEDGGPSDWFTDTRPAVMEAIGKIRSAVEQEIRALASAEGGEA